MAEQQKEDQTTGKARKRSPNFPYASLRDCVELIKKMHKQVGTSKVLIESAYKYMGLRPTSSSTDRIRAALSSYKLTEEQYQNKQRFINLTDLSHRIAVDVREVSMDRLTAYREAALNDAMTKKVWEEEWMDGLPLDDATIISILRMKYKFQEEAAKRFASVLKDNFAFAQLDESFTDADYEEVEDQGDSRYNGGHMEQKPSTPPEKIESAIRHPIPLDNDRYAYIYLPPTVTEDDAEFIPDFINLLLKKIKRSQKANEQQETKE